MPELPEVETVRRGLASTAVDRCIRSVWIGWARLVGHPEPETFPALLLGRRLTGWERRGKYLLARLDPPGWWVVHLRMTGRLRVTDPTDGLGPPDEKHLHARIELSGGTVLEYRDVRKFGRFYLLPDGPFRREAGAPPGLAALGPEPLTGQFGPERLLDAADGRRLAIKALLLDQQVVAGIGNIYADEVLFRARIAPDRAAGSLSRREAERLVAAVDEVLRAAIRWGGTSFRDYRDGFGNPGGYAERLDVYGRAGEPCRRCETPLEQLRLAGRSTTFCPRCQGTRAAGRIADRAAGEEV